MNKKIRKSKSNFLTELTWLTLTNTQKLTRKLALEAKRLINEGETVINAAKQVGLSKKTLLKHLGPFLYKKGSRIKAYKVDQIERAMRIKTNGHEIVIIVKGSIRASRIAQHHAAVRRFLDTRKLEILEPFKNRGVRDVKGKLHKFETNPTALFDIENSKEASEFYEIYES